MIKQSAIVVAGGLALASGLATAQSPMGSMDHGSMGHGQMSQDQMSQGTMGEDAAGAEALPGSPATQAYRAANQAMHEAMDLEFTDDADIDFARGMIGHHQGAIAMARVVLEHGEDPDLRALAEEVIAAQEAEIAFLRDWLAKRGM